MRGTFRWIERELGAGRGLYYRYPESRGVEGAFGICGFWAVEHLALGGGTLARACEAFDELVGVANDVGLLSEEVDPVTGDALGNFPQAFSHVGLVSAALAIRERARGMERPRTPRRLRRRPLAHPEMRA
jgi:GH15 family glucan-1,4-alpha-glucosidase